MYNNIFITQKYHFTSLSSFNKNWKLIENFKNKNLLLEKSIITKIPPSIESCDCVQITTKFSRKFSFSERILRILLGLILVILTLGLALIFKPIRQLFIKDHISLKLVKPIWFSKNINFDLENSLESSPSFTFQQIDHVKLQKIISENIHNIKTKTPSQDITVFKSRNYIFSLKQFPGWIFKTNFNDHTKTLQRYEYTQNVSKFCKENKFDNIVIPESHLIKLNIYGKLVPVIVEKKLNIESNPCHQENLYSQYSNDYSKALSELVHLICQKNLQDIKWENCPLLFDNSTKTFSKIALIDLEQLSFTEKDEGLFGSSLWNRRGIIQCLPPKHFPLIKSIISKYNKSLKKYEICVQKRLAELHRNQKISLFYQNKGIVCGNEPLTLNPKSLLEEIDLDLEETCNGFTMKTAALETIEYINEKLIKIPQNPYSIQQARIVNLTRTPPHLGIFHQSFGYPNTYKGEDCNKEEKSWLALIIRALIKKGLLYDVISYSSSNFQIQA